AERGDGDDHPVRPGHHLDGRGRRRGREFVVRAGGTRDQRGPREGEGGTQQHPGCFHGGVPLVVRPWFTYSDAMFSRSSVPCPIDGRSNPISPARILRRRWEAFSEGRGVAEPVMSTDGLRRL